MAQDWSDLDTLFSCPDSVTDEKLRELYEVLVARLRTEMTTIEPNTGQLIQASLMTGWAVKHMSTSKAVYGEKSGYQHPGQEKDAILALEAIIRDWNDNLLKSRIARDRVTQGIPVKVVQEVLAGALSGLDQEARMPIISAIADGLSAYAG